MGNKIELLKTEFFEDLNPGIKFKDLKRNTKEAIVWKCKYGHEWQSKVSTRLRNKKSKDDLTLCPICYKKSKQSNGLDFLNKIFDKHKNNHNSIDYYKVKGKEKIWWVCDRGHSYKKKLSEIFYQNKKINGKKIYLKKEEKNLKKCPKCEIEDDNLKSLLQKEYHPEKNSIELYEQTIGGDIKMNLEIKGKSP